MNKRSLAYPTTRLLGRWRAARVPISALLVFLLALAPRALAVGRFLTIDEAYHWFERGRLFLRAIRGADWAATNLVGHPGVTTMWLGASGFMTHYTLSAWGLAAWPDPDLLRVLVRLPVALVTSLCVALSYALLRRLVPARLALLAALFWAGDPFLVAHSQILHVDALLTSFMTLALLAGLLAFRLDDSEVAGPRLRWGMLIGSGGATGLALLTKSPSVVLAPMLGLIALVAAWRRRKAKDQGPRTKDQATTGHPIMSARQLVSSLWPLVILPMLAWGLCVLLVWFALWPAAWLDPIGAIRSIVRQAADDGGSPHGWGNFFLGRAVADPGPLFYPVAIALRLTPWSLIGLVAAVPAAALAWRRGQARRGLPLIVLAIFCLLFGAAMTLGPKKFDRYALPIFPTLDLIAAFGMLWLWDTLRRGVRRGAPAATSDSRERPATAAAGLLLAVLVLAANLAWHHPYEMAYYNQLLGGGPVAATLIPVGWGEGLEQAGDYIRSRPDGAALPVATWYQPALQPYVSAHVSKLAQVLSPGQVGYAVLYIDQEQRRNEPEVIDMLRAQLKPIHTVRINGIDYAKIYQIPPPVARPIDADFGPAIHLRGYDVDTTTPGALTLTLDWAARAAIPADYMLFVHVMDAAGARVGQIDIPAGEPARTSGWAPDSYARQRMSVPLAADAPAGSYWIAIGLYDPRAGARLSLRTSSPQPAAPSDGEGALLLGPAPLK
ncbi:MAG: glycosyltransferase family 39 protein [Kouleothrix sp.]|nr:glycosyltransferase family 39 protein [Kouleothrix sp.]